MIMIHDNMLLNKANTVNWFYNGFICSRSINKRIMYVYQSNINIFNEYNERKFDSSCR